MALNSKKMTIKTINRFSSYMLRCYRDSNLTEFNIATYYQILHNYEVVIDVIKANVKDNNYNSFAVLCYAGNVLKNM